MMLWLLLILPAMAAGLCILVRSPRQMLVAVGGGVGATAVAAAYAAWTVFRSGPVFTASNWIFLDALSAYHLLVMMLVFTLSSVYAVTYFEDLLLRDARRYALLWLGSFAGMILAMISNNLGILWVGIEASTVLTAFLICTHLSPASLEAMWKYLIMCSVGVAFAFMGTLFFAASIEKLHLEGRSVLLWTRMMASTGNLDPTLVKAGFLFLLVGYGTKVGLAPMHSWLPDAHSQAPSPVSAIFSGFMLNSSLYCIMRFVPLVEGSLGHTGWSRQMLVLFGLVSILVAAAFIVAQKDLKRMLAYSSVEHLGLITLGIGLGGLGTFAALFHTLNHSVGKTLAFFSAGKIGQAYETQEMSKISGALRVSPVWGAGLVGSILALIGAAPFAIFMSEFQMVKAALESGSILTLVLLLLGLGIVFIGALRHLIGMAWGTPDSPREQKAGAVESMLVAGGLAALLVLGLWMPTVLKHAIDQAARVIGGTP